MERRKTTRLGEATLRFGKANQVCNQIQEQGQRKMLKYFLAID
jgi:hypothetical protein